MADIYKPHNIIVSISTSVELSFPDRGHKSPLALAEQNARVTILDCPNRHTGGARARMSVFHLCDASC